MNERRKFKRYSIAYPIEGAEVSELYNESLLDVSRSGIAFIGRDDLRKEEQITIRLFLKSRRFDLKAVVVHIRKNAGGEYVIGARFLEPPEEFEYFFDKEIDEITHLYRETNLRRHEHLSFKRVSREYLKAPQVS